MNSFRGAADRRRAGKGGQNVGGGRADVKKVLKNQAFAGSVPEASTVSDAMQIG